MSSRSSADLTNRLLEVRDLASLDPLRSGDSSRRLISNAVNRACILLLSAHLEGFLEDLVQEALDYVVSTGASVSQLPLVLRALHTEKHLRELEPIKDRNARAPRIEKLFQEQAPLWANGTPLQPSMIKQSVVRAEMSNPGSSEIQAFLRYINVDIDAFLRALGELPLLGRIDGLIWRRNQVAHGEVSATATPSDIDGYITLIIELGRHIDVAVAIGVQTLCNLPMLPW